MSSGTRARAGDLDERVERLSWHGDEHEAVAEPLAAKEAQPSTSV
jgi:hypothetical protein